jgi:phage internal scaffolding protein
MFTGREHKRNKDGSFKDDKVEATRIKEFPDGLTEQSHKQECDMHHIYKRALRQGIDALNDNTLVNWQESNYLGVPDYQAAMNMIAKTDQMFDQVPAEIRRKFENDPAKFVDFMSNPDNYQAIQDMGLSTTHLPTPETVVTETAVTEEPATV